MGVETAGVKHSMNPFDEIAVEQVRFGNDGFTSRFSFTNIKD